MSIDLEWSFLEPSDLEVTSSRVFSSQAASKPTDVLGEPGGPKLGKLLALNDKQ
jgi:hypothetical protein